MIRALSGLIGALVLLALAFSPPLMALAESNDYAHGFEHLLVLLAGLLVAYAGRSLVRRLLTLDPSLAGWANGVVALGLMFLLVTLLPAVDALADTVMVVHVLVHGMILGSGWLIGTGLFARAIGMRRADSTHPGQAS